MSNFSRRGFIKSTGVLVGLPFISPFSQKERKYPPEKAPNIVFLFSDDHSVPDLGCYGNPAIHTPNLDRMASEGIRFNRAYVTSSQCSPSRASVFTGRTPHEVNASRLHADVPVPETNLVRLLNKQGYFTGAYRKVHQSNIRNEFHFYANGGREVPLSRFFEERPDDRPFFLWFGCRDPHREYGPGAFEPPHKPEEVIVPGYLPDTPKVRQDLAYYYDEIARFDRECGEILSLLDEQGMTGETMVVMAGDNGLPFPRAKATLYEPGIRVPLLVRYPGKVEAGQVSEALVSLVDLTSTWLEAAGVEIPETMPSKSLWPLLTGKTGKIRDFIYSERNWHDNWDPMRCVVGERYKLIQNFRPEIPYYPSLDVVNSASYEQIEQMKKSGELTGKLGWYDHNSRPRVELYDLKEDPDEWKNLADSSKHRKRKDEYQVVLSDWMLETNDFLPPPKRAFPGGAESTLNQTIDPLNGKPR